MNDLPPTLTTVVNMPVTEVAKHILRYEDREARQPVFKIIYFADLGQGLKPFEATMPDADTFAAREYSVTFHYRSQGCTVPDQNYLNSSAVIADVNPEWGCNPDRTTRIRWRHEQSRNPELEKAFPKLDEILKRLG